MESVTRYEVRCPVLINQEPCTYTSKVYHTLLEAVEDIVIHAHHEHGIHMDMTSEGKVLSVNNCVCQAGRQ